MTSKQVKPKEQGKVSHVPPAKNKPNPLLRTTQSYSSLTAENKKLKDELEVALASNKKMETKINTLTKRAEELAAAKNNLEKALAREKMKSNRLTSVETISVNSVEVQNIEALKDWKVIRKTEEYEAWALKLTTKEKKNEMAKYLEENVDGETLRDALIQSLKLLFSKTFFVKKISFGYETGRVHFKNSNLLQALRLCLAKKFPDEDTSTKAIQKKIRNFNDALSKNDDLWVELDSETTDLNLVGHDDNDDLESSETNNSEVSSAEELFCLCKSPASGKMVLCDNDSCSIKWYHFACVSVVTKPKGKWYCVNCRSVKK